MKKNVLVENFPMGENSLQSRNRFWNPLHSWRRKWQPIPVFLPGESHEQRSLVGYSPWGCKSQHNLTTKPSPLPSKQKERTTYLEYQFSTRTLSIFLTITTVGGWRSKWQPTPVLLPGKSPGQRSLAGYSA